MAVYKDEERKTWYTKYKYRDSNGKIRYTTKRGFKTKKEAQAYEYEFKATSKDKLEMTVRSLAAKYLEDKKIRVKIGTYKNMESIINKYVLPKIGRYTLSEITPVNMREWQNELISGGNLKSGTLRTIHINVSSMFNHAVKYYGLKQNPLRITGSIGQPESSVNFWTVEEFERAMEYVKNEKHRLCFKLLFYGGMRVGELLALKKEDINYDKKQIRINKSKIYLTGEISTPKTRYSIRTVDMPDEIMKELKTYVTGVEGETIFATDSSSLLSVLKRCAVKAGVKKIRIHDLRHSHASLLINLGLPITTISKRLGHKSPKITLEIYSHMYEDSGKEAAEMLNKIIEKK